jgi:hypothetical protein
MRWDRRDHRRARLSLLFPRPFRAPPPALLKDDVITPAFGLSAAYGCRTPGCERGTCARCTSYRAWGARSACRGCGCPLDSRPHVFVNGRPLCGECE